VFLIQILNVQKVPPCSIMSDRLENHFSVIISICISRKENDFSYPKMEIQGAV